MYADKLMNEPELKLWHDETDSKKRMAIPLTDEIEVCLERFYFNAYCNWFGKGTFSKAIAQIPMINMVSGVRIHASLYVADQRSFTAR